MHLSCCGCILQELLLKLVEDYYPMPADPDADANAAQKPAASKGRARRPDARPSRRVCPMNVLGICTDNNIFRKRSEPLPWCDTRTWCMLVFVTVARDQMLYCSAVCSGGGSSSSSSSGGGS